jgi:hypothetical protein
MYSQLFRSLVLPRLMSPCMSGTITLPTMWVEMQTPSVSTGQSPTVFVGLDLSKVSKVCEDGLGYDFSGKQLTNTARFLICRFMVLTG